MCNIWIIAAAFKRMKNSFCRLGIVSNIPKYKGSGTNPLITQIIPNIDPRTELKFGNLSYCSQNGKYLNFHSYDFRFQNQCQIFPLSSQKQVIVTLCLVPFKTQQFIIKKYNPKNQSPTNHSLIRDTFLKPLVPECVWHFYKDISHNKIPVHSFILIATKIFLSSTNPFLKNSSSFG